MGGNAPWLFLSHTLLVVVGRKGILFAARVTPWVIKERLKGLFWAVCPAIIVLFVTGVFLEKKTRLKADLWPLSPSISTWAAVALLFKVAVKRSIGIMADPSWQSPWLHSGDFSLFSFALSVNIAGPIQRGTGPGCLECLQGFLIKAPRDARRVRACLQPFQRADSLLSCLVFK